MSLFKWKRHTVGRGVYQSYTKIGAYVYVINRNETPMGHHHRRSWTLKRQHPSGTPGFAYLYTLKIKGTVQELKRLAEQDAVERALEAMR